MAALAETLRLEKPPPLDPDARPEVLEAKLHEVENSIANLKRSNKELAEALKQGEDPDFREAINENVVVILRQQALACEIRRLLELVASLTPRVDHKDETERIRRGLSADPAGKSMLEGGGVSNPSGTKVEGAPVAVTSYEPSESLDGGGLFL